MKYILFLSFFIASSAIAQQPDSSSAIFSMREAEWNFARQSVMFGRNTAFVNNFAEKSVIFTDKWISNAKQFWKERKPGPSVLKWEPEFMDISESRDFGVSTGPWESQEFRPGTDPTGYGYFLTVWQMQEGTWKVILDAGAGTPQKKHNTHNFEFPKGSDKDLPKPAIIDPSITAKELSDKDQKFSESWNKNPISATFTGFLAENSRLQRNGYLPTINRDTITGWINNLDKKLAWVATGSGAASSGDLGFTYGMLENTGPDKAVKGHYVRIWKKIQGQWMIILEMSSLNS